MQTAVEIQGLSKRFGRVQAVTGLDLTVTGGRVTGFLGPNGAGKSTTLRVLLGLIHADAGTATFAGRRYDELPAPAPTSAPCSRTPASTRGAAAGTTCGCWPPPAVIPPGRVDEVLDQVGLTDRADRRVKGYSMGMRQRLAIAAALLGDPEVLILDEPTNGLDPPGIRWVRDLVRHQAGVGRAVLISSHLLSEVAQSVDDIVVIAERHAAGAGPARPGARRRPAGDDVRAGRRPDPPGRGPRAAGEDRRTRGPDGMVVRGATPGDVGLVAAQLGVALIELRPLTRSLEDAFLDPDGGPAVIDLFHAELLKLRTTRTFVALTAIGVATSLLIAVLVSILTEPTRGHVLTDVFASDTSSFFILVLAVIGITGEWRHRTITSSLLAAPDRVRFLAAKTISRTRPPGSWCRWRSRSRSASPARRSCRSATCRSRRSASSSARPAATLQWPRCSARSASASAGCSATRSSPSSRILVLGFVVEPTGHRARPRRRPVRPDRGAPGGGGRPPCGEHRQQRHRPTGRPARHAGTCSPGSGSPSRLPPCCCSGATSRHSAPESPGPVR